MDTKGKAFRQKCAKDHLSSTMAEDSLSLKSVESNATRSLIDGRWPVHQHCEIFARSNTLFETARANNRNGQEQDSATQVIDLAAAANIDR
jgi:hypothetical protein